MPFWTLVAPGRLSPSVQLKRFSSWLVLMEHWDGLGMEPVAALAAMLLQHEGGLHTEQSVAATLDLPSQHLHIAVRTDTMLVFFS